MCSVQGRIAGYRCGRCAKCRTYHRVVRVGGEERGWVEGQALLFDDSFLHEVRNNCSSRRVVLQAVFAHPGLSALEVVASKSEL